MGVAIRRFAKVEAGGRIEVTDASLPPGVAVEVIVLLPEPRSKGSSSLIDVLGAAPGGLLFRSASDVARYLNSGRDEWDN